MWVIQSIPWFQSLRANACCLVWIQFAFLSKFETCQQEITYTHTVRDDRDRLITCTSIQSNFFSFKLPDSMYYSRANGLCLPWFSSQSIWLHIQYSIFVQYWNCTRLIISLCIWVENVTVFTYSRLNTCRIKCLWQYLSMHVPAELPRPLVERNEASVSSLKAIFEFTSVEELAAW